MEIKFSGHRGYKAKEIENTKAGFLKAIEEKLDYIELDVRKTSDKIPVVFHDSKINRLLNGRGKVKNFTLNEMKSFKYRDSQSIISLEELFIEVGGKVKFILDIKSKGIEKEVLNLINRFSLEKDVIIQSFRGKNIKKYYKIAPGLDYALYRAFHGKITIPHKLFTPIWYYFFIKRYKITYASLDGPFMYNEFINRLNRDNIKIILGAMRVEKYLKNVYRWNIAIINANNPEIIKRKLQDIKEFKIDNKNL